MNKSRKENDIFLFTCNRSAAGSVGTSVQSARSLVGLGAERIPGNGSRGKRGVLPS